MIVNGILAAVINEEEFVSQSGMRNLLTRVRKEGKKQYEKIQRVQVCLKFDPKCSDVSRGVGDRMAIKDWKTAIYESQIFCNSLYLNIYLRLWLTMYLLNL